MLIAKSKQAASFSMKYMAIEENVNQIKCFIIEDPCLC